jgi:hypothetical protein
VRESMLRVDSVLPQLVHLVMSSHALVSIKACEVLALLAAEHGAASSMERAALLSTLHKLMRGQDVSLLLAGLEVSIRVILTAMFLPGVP